MTDPIGTAQERELIEFLRAEAGHYDKTIYKHTVRKFTETADALQSRIAEVADLELALELALAWLSRFEPGDSRAVSNEFVAMAAILCKAGRPVEECREIVRAALSLQRRV